MEYYIQGDAANADKIKAAFEKLGYDVTGFDMCNNNILFFTYKLQGGGKVISTTNANLYTANIIKTHPNYKELELPVEPKFKVGDWVVYCGKIYQVTNIGETLYTYTSLKTGSFFFNKIETTDNSGSTRLWTIADAKDGDVLATDNGWTCIFKAFDGCVFSSYCFMDSQKWFCEFGSEAHTPDSRINGNIHPATQKQRNILFKKMQEAGYQWYAGKKELRKIKPHYDIANFYAGMPVLARADNNCRWDYSVFSRVVDNEYWHFAVCNGVCFTQCIPFNEDTRHLLGTTDPCDEQYINW